MILRSRSRTGSVRPTGTGGRGCRTLPQPSAGRCPQAEPAGADALEGIDQLGELDFGRVVHERVDVVLFAVELFQLGLEVGADLPHDLFGAGQHGVGERVAPVLRNKNQASMQMADNMATGSDIGIRIPAR